MLRLRGRHARRLDRVNGLETHSPQAADEHPGDQGKGKRIPDQKARLPKRHRRVDAGAGGLDALQLEELVQEHHPAAAQ